MDESFFTVISTLPCLCLRVAMTASIATVIFFRGIVLISVISDLETSCGLGYYIFFVHTVSLYRRTNTRVGSCGLLPFIEQLSLNGHILSWRAVCCEDGKQL